MRQLETNIYPISNLDELATGYRLVEIAGLRSDQAEYFQNRQLLTRTLSYSLKKPVIVVERRGVPYVVVPEDVTALPAEVALVRVVVHLRMLEERIALNYQARGEDDDIAFRFLRFLLQAPLRADGRLWQPSAGRPFFQRKPRRPDDRIQCFRGFSVRPVPTPDGGIGLCVDVTRCYVGANPLPSVLRRDEFASRWKARNCIYRFGVDWYEIHLEALADRCVKDYRFEKDGKTWSLIDYIQARAGRPQPLDLGSLKENASVVLYRDSRGMEFGAPAPLCYPTFHTSDDEVARQHGRALLDPDERRNATRWVVDEYFSNLKFGGTRLRIDSRPISIPSNPHRLPDLRFGRETVLSARNTAGAVHSKISDFGRRRMELLANHDVGFFEAAPLDRQYLLLPKSVHDTMGDQFIQDLASTMDNLFPQPDGYKPIIVPYEDRGDRTFVRQARAIRLAVEKGGLQPGYALVMVHRSSDRNARDEDQLASMVVRELREKEDIRAAVIHSDVPRRAYRESRRSNGQVAYEVAGDEARKLNGYLRNVALTKILLTNQRWPFVLASPLNADVTIGIDVKNNTAGMLIVGAHGHEIRSDLYESRQREQLLASQMTKYLVHAMEREMECRGRPLTSFVIHRDGRAWPSEIAGIRHAIAKLRTAGTLASNVKYAVLEVSKSSPAPLRLYDVERHGPNLIGRNPLVGSAYVLDSQKQAYLCSTGYPFLRNGTAHPLHITMVDGDLPFADAVGDLFSLTALTWTQPEGCTRYPITIKLNDRILSAEAGEYDVDAIEFESDSEAVDEEVA